MTNSTDTMRQWGLTLLRLVVGAVFVAHGAQKLFFMGLHNVADSWVRSVCPKRTRPPSC